MKSDLIEAASDCFFEKLDVLFVKGLFQQDVQPYHWYLVHS
jgi:hypothetical protein